MEQLTVAGSDVPTDEFSAVFQREYPRLFQYAHRLCGDRDLAEDVAQEALVRLHARGGAPDSTPAWLITVATNLLRNARTKACRQARLLHDSRAQDDAPDRPDAAVLAETRARVRATLESLSPRDQQLLSMFAGGYSYRDIALALDLNDASIGTLLARAKRAFRAHYGSDNAAP